MTLDFLRTVIEEHIKETEHYDIYLDKKIQPKLTEVGYNTFLRLRFYNSGFNAAMQTILALIPETPCIHHWEPAMPDKIHLPEARLAICKLCGAFR